ncbi:MAG: type II toxin-antitoxin system RelE/ParE family toxin [Anaerolineales bacterium]|nr:type II toxin-antitoxin system RelE/ParE family toxin [Anaerolineales bacterium]
MWQIRFYEDHRGKRAALEFINQLPPRDRAKVFNTLCLLQEFGLDLGMPHARRIEGRLWELRPGNNRLFYFLYVNETFVILHGFRKQSMKTPEREVETALRRMQEILEELE